MKKTIIVATMIITGAFTAKAQNTATANALLNVNVSNVKSITVSAGSTVNIDLNTTEKFTQAAGSTGVQGNEKTTLDVVSNGAYKIQVTLANADVSLKNSNANATGITAIPVDKIYLTVDNARQIVAGSTAPSAAFSNTKQNLINQTASNLIATPASQSTSGNAGTSGTKYDVTYTLANYADVASLAVGTFSGTVIYTITDL